VRKYLRHPFWQALLVMVLAYLVFVFGLAYVPPLLGIRSAPLPASVVLQYTVTVLVGVILYVSSSEDRWREFKEPMQQTLVAPERRGLRAGLMVAIPVLVGILVYTQVRPTIAAPPNLRSIHPAPPTQITFQGRPIVLAGLENPLRADGDVAQDYAEGKRVYYQNCVACHGDALDGAGHYAHGFNPAPANFRDNGTIAQLTESFVFWRIAKGGPGLPQEGGPWNSAMPAWEDFLTEEEIWAVTIFLYEQTGWTPRTWEAAEGGGH